MSTRSAHVRPSSFRSTRYAPHPRDINLAPCAHLISKIARKLVLYVELRRGKHNFFTLLARGPNLLVILVSVAAYGAHK